MPHPHRGVPMLRSLLLLLLAAALHILPAITDDQLKAVIKAGTAGATSLSVDGALLIASIDADGLLILTLQDGTVYTVVAATRTDGSLLVSVIRRRQPGKAEENLGGFVIPAGFQPSRIAGVLVLPAPAPEVLGDPVQGNTDVGGFNGPVIPSGSPGGQIGGPTINTNTPSRN